MRCGTAAAAGPAKQLLGHDAGQGIRQHAANLRLLVRREGVDEALDGGRGGVGVHRGEDEHAEARELEGEAHGLGTAELAH